MELHKSEDEEAKCDEVRQMVAAFQVSPAIVEHLARWGLTRPEHVIVAFQDDKEVTRWVEGAPGVAEDKALQAARCKHMWYSFMRGARRAASSTHESKMREGLRRDESSDERDESDSEAGRRKRRKTSHSLDWRAQASTAQGAVGAVTSYKVVVDDTESIITPASSGSEAKVSDTLRGSERSNRFGEASERKRTRKTGGNEPEVTGHERSSSAAIVTKQHDPPWQAGPARRQRLR